MMTAAPLSWKTMCVNCSRDWQKSWMRIKWWLSSSIITRSHCSTLKQYKAALQRLVGRLGVLIFLLKINKNIITKSLISHCSSYNFFFVRLHPSQTLTKHRRHIQVLKIMLHDTHGRRNNLVKQLKKTEHKLLDMKGTLKNLEQFSKDHSLLEREELTHRLAQTSEDLKEKDKKIQVSTVWTTWRLFLTIENCWGHMFFFLHILALEVSQCSGPVHSHKMACFLASTWKTCFKTSFWFSTFDLNMKILS